MKKPLITLVAMLIAGAGGSLVNASPAEASTLESRALGVAISKKGSPYQYGAAGPTRFDCSGLTLYSFKKAGRTLPRTAQAQYNKIRHISKASRRLGDLVFFGGTKSIYHVGIYAGGGYIWHAPHTGAKVRKERIWTSSVHYGRP
jgi:cell wall-associated NlpC family hydrolase